MCVCVRVCVERALTLYAPFSLSNSFALTRYLYTGNKVIKVATNPTFYHSGGISISTKNVSPSLGEVVKFGLSGYLDYGFILKEGGAADNPGKAVTDLMTNTVSGQLGDVWGQLADTFVLQAGFQAKADATFDFSELFANSEKKGDDGETKDTGSASKGVAALIPKWGPIQFAQMDGFLTSGSSSYVSPDVTDGLVTIPAGAYLFLSDAEGVPTALKDVLDFMASFLEVVVVSTGKAKLTYMTSWLPLAHP